MFIGSLSLFLVCMRTVCVIIAVLLGIRCYRVVCVWMGVGVCACVQRNTVRGCDYTVCYNSKLLYMSICFVDYVQINILGVDW